jgi:putative transposase
MVGPAAKREAVAHLRSVLQMSERRACILVAADHKMVRYRSHRPPDDLSALRGEKLTVRKRKVRRRAVGTRTPILVEAKVKARWSLDFVTIS